MHLRAAQVIDLNAPLVAPRECTYLTAQAELGGGARLLVEANVQVPEAEDGQPSEQQQQQLDALGARSCVSTQWFAAYRLSPVEGENEVDLTMACEVHLCGELQPHFQANYLDARTELLDSINGFVSKPEWEAKREQLLANGPHLERMKAPSSGSGKTVRQQWLPRTAAADTAFIELDRTPESMLHLAQVPPVACDACTHAHEDTSMRSRTRAHTFPAGRESERVSEQASAVRRRSLASRVARRPLST